MNLVLNKNLASVLYRSRPINSIYCRFLSKENLPDKAENENVQVQQKQPERPRIIPVKQALLAKIPVEYHGISESKFNDDTVWLPLFVWPYIRQIRFFFRLNMYLSIGSIGLGGAYIYDLYAGNPNAPLMNTVLLATCAFSSMILTGYLSSKIVGRIYVSEDGTSLRVGRFSFFSSRKDMVVPMECVIPLTDLNEDNKRLFVNMKFHKPRNIDLSKDAIEFYDQVHLLPLKLGGVTDAELFEKILGNILTKKKLSQYK